MVALMTDGVVLRVCSARLLMAKTVSTSGFGLLVGFRNDIVRSFFGLLYCICGKLNKMVFFFSHSVYNCA